jgi:single-stranded DNA-binding protein
MSRGIEAATFATVARAGERRTSKAGNAFAMMTLATESGQQDENGRDVPLYVKAFAFGDLVDVAAGLEKGRRVYVEGALSIGLWHGENGTRIDASLKASKLEPTQIGRNKPRRTPDEAQQPLSRPTEQEPLNDSIPF